MFDEFAVVYRACALAGLPDTRRVDEMELWEIAAVIGANDPPDTSSNGTPTVTAPRSAGPDPWNVARAVALDRGLPQPEHGMDVDEFLAQSAALGIPTPTNGAGGG